MPGASAPNHASWIFFLPLLCTKLFFIPLTAFPHNHSYGHLLERIESGYNYYHQPLERRCQCRGLNEQSSVLKFLEKGRSQKIEN